MAVGNSLANKQEKTPLTAYLTNDAVKKQINNVVGGKNGTRFISSIVSAVQTTPALQECTNPSILSAALLGEALNLSPSPQLGQYYLVPFNNKNKGCKEAQFQLGYKGYIQLAKRSGVYKKINVISIKEGELVSYNPLEEELEVNLIEDDIIREETPTIGYYAMFEEVNGYKHSMYWSKRKMLAHADKYSQAFHLHAVTSSNPKYSRVSYEDFEKGNYPKEDAWKYSSFWYKDFDAMAHKTMLRQLISKWGTMSIDLQTAVEKDMAVIREDGTPEYVENEETDDNVAVEQEYREAGLQEEPEQTESSLRESDGQMSMEDEFFRGL
ncbi:recombinase RecT [Blautia producta]|uniref:recombinase RecT n=1 Tax=Blautia producta TaxID=33035 RepID=UPI00210C4503|nr:recombinase RecT [Blautia producta]MCQ5125859.1 recombinase RecT [Blautia producta]